MQNMMTGYPLEVTVMDIAEPLGGYENLDRTKGRFSKQAFIAFITITNILLDG